MQQVGRYRGTHARICQAGSALWRVLESSSDGLFVVNLESESASVWVDSRHGDRDPFRFAVANRACRELLGCHDRTGELTRLGDCLPPTIAHRLQQALTRCLKERTRVEFQLVGPRHRSQPTEPLHVRLEPEIGSGGKVVRIFGWCQAIAAPGRRPGLASDTALAHQIAVGVAAAQTLDDGFHLALEQIGKTLGWDYGEIWMPRSDGSHLECERAWYRSTRALLQFRRIGEKLTFPPAMGLPGRIWVSQQPEWHPDVSQVSTAIFHRSQLAKRVKLKAAVGLPIVFEGQVQAVFVFLGYERREEDPQTLQTLKAIAAELGSVVRQKLADDALRQAEQKYRSLFENAVEGIFQTTPEGKYLTVNPMLAKIYGYDSQSELIGEIEDIEVQLYVDPNRRSEFKRLLEKHDAIWDFQSQIYRRDGSIIWISENARTLRDANGKAIAYEGTVKDISEHKQAEERFAALVQNSSDIIIVLEEDGTIQYGSPSLERILGYAPETLCGQNLLDYVHPQDRVALDAVLDDRPTPSPSPVEAIEYRLRHADGSWVHLESAINNRLNDPNIGGWIVNSHDISHRIATENEIRHRLSAQEALSRISRLFVTAQDPDWKALLAILGSALGVDRAYILQLNAQGRLMGHPHCWPYRQTEGSPASPSLLLPESSPWILGCLHSGRLLRIGDRDRLPGTRHLEKSLLERHQIRALILIPIHSQDGNLLGCLGADRIDKHHPWSDTDAHLLQVVSEMLSGYYQRKQAEIALRQAEQKYRSIFENAVEGIFQTSPDGQYLTVNPMLAKIYGYDSPQELMASLTDIEHQLYVDPDRRAYFQLLMQERDAVWNFESQIYRKDGSTIWIAESARPIRDEAGNLLGYEGTVVDITQRKQAELEVQRRDRLLQGVAEAMNHLLTETRHEAAISKALATLGEAVDVDRVYICQLKNGIRSFPQPIAIAHGNGHGAFPRPDAGPSENPFNTIAQVNADEARDREGWEFYTQFEWTREGGSRLCGDRCSLLAERRATAEALFAGNAVTIAADNPPIRGDRHFDDDPARSFLLVPIVLSDRVWGYIGFDDRGNTNTSAADPTVRRWTESEESILLAIAGSLGGALKRHSYEEFMRHQAYHDLLTGLPNRQLLDDRLPLALEIARERGHQLAVMFLDLDRFKIINDTLGHAVGDELLKSAAQRLRGCLREEDTLVRWGGDEFILILDSLVGERDAIHVAERLLEVLRPPFEIDGHQLYITSSIGIALYPRDGDDAETLIKNADIALYEVKQRGRNNYHVYTCATNAETPQFLILDNYLHHALEREEFALEYQPIFDTRSGSICAIEALLRWHHPDLGLVSPQTFLPIAEENGAIVELGQWAIGAACSQTRAWQDAGLTRVPLVVNLSTRQFQQSDLVPMLVEILQETGLDPRWLELEITEMTAMQDVELTAQLLVKLKRAGVSLSIDDFGIGYASLNYLKQFAFQTLKIDRSFVGNLTVDPAQKAIVAATIALADALNIKVVAEGVETEAQRESLQSLGCDRMQGYLFKPPVSAEAIAPLLVPQLPRPSPRSSFEL
ncbi:EAL domain-containing protein [Oxynema sp. CENA135]|nr:EAL domain-containing protein [Oxynema sp. CENA135]MBK4732139.1 EAL domain-containing protein [Oxynema sp. CENA135]